MSRLFKAVGISYKNTPLQVREAVTFDESATKRFLVRLKEVLDLEEALLVSTCNRTEIYYLSENDLTEPIAKLVDIFHGNTGAPSAGFFQPLYAEAAVAHLFRVSIGLESAVLGDLQISNQVKKAYQWSADESMAGPFIHRLMHTIFFTSKRVVQETPFRDGTASLASVAVQLTEHFIRQYHAPRIAVIGLGDIGGNVAENLKGIGAEVLLLNRTHEKAEQMAQELSFEARPLAQLDEVLNEVHVVISAVQTEKPLIEADQLPQIVHPKLLIDLSVPRSIAEDAGHVPGYVLYNVDQLSQKTSEALERRKSAIPAVEALVTEGLAEFENWSQEMEVSPVIKKFKQALEDIRQQELARYVGKMNEKDLEVLDKVTKSMIQKVVKMPVLQLKAACKRGDAENLAGVLNDLFNLEKQESFKD